MNLLILVVDDEPDVEVLFRQQFRRDLRAGRFTMEFAQSAPMALQRITDAAGVSLILILSDINMPGMSGLELLPKAKALRPDVPVIMITAYGDAETKRKALENGAEALLTKPIDFGTLRSEIDTRIEGTVQSSVFGALIGHEACASRFLLSGVKPTSDRTAATSSCDPDRHNGFSVCAAPHASMKTPGHGRLTEITTGRGEPNEAEEYDCPYRGCSGVAAASYPSLGGRADLSRSSVTQAPPSRYYSRDVRGTSASWFH